jgi:hypothetical protein
LCFLHGASGASAEIRWRDKPGRGRVFIFAAPSGLQRKNFLLRFELYRNKRCSVLAQRVLTDGGDFMIHNLSDAKPNDDGLNPEQRLLEELYRQRTELGEIAAELISLLEAAGVSTTNGPDSRSVDSPPE